MKNNKILGIVLPVFYVITAVVSTISAVKLTSVFGYAVSVAMFLYPFTFLLKDMIQKRLGKKTAEITVWTSAAALVFTSLVFLFMGSLSSHESWSDQDAFSTILTPMLRVAIASVVASVIGELINIRIFSYMYKKFNSLVAGLSSNIIAVTVDSVLFTLIAFYGQVPTEVLVSIGVSAALLKYMLVIIFSPSIVLVKPSKHEEI